MAQNMAWPTRRGEGEKEDPVKVLDNAKPTYDREKTSASEGTSWNYANIAKAIEIGQKYEISQKQLSVIRDEEPHILALIRKNWNLQAKYFHQPDETWLAKRKHCSRCGKDPQHDWNQGKCPALGSTYLYCKRPNHWLAVCIRRLCVHNKSCQHFI